MISSGWVGSVELELGSSGRVSGSPSIKRLASSDDATSLDQESRMPRIREFCRSDQKALILSAFACTPWLRISGTCSSSGGAGGGTVGISVGPVAVGIPSSRRGSRVGPGIPESISTSKFHFVPRASIVSRRLHCSLGGFLRNDLHWSKPCFVPTRCSSDDASRPHQEPLIHLFVSLAARTS